MFDWLKKKARLEQMDSGLVHAFSKVKEDLSAQKAVLEELYEGHHGLRKTTNVNHERIAEWITHFNESILRLEKDIKELEKAFKSDISKFSDTSLQLIREAHIKNASDAAILKKEILAEVGAFLQKSQEKPKKQVIINEPNVNNVKNIMPDTHYDALSNPEKWLVGVLFSTETPLSYSQIAERTGKSVNTVRVYMNQLKFKDFIDESALPNGVKLFSLRHKAKVKKLYNL